MTILELIERTWDIDIYHNHVSFNDLQTLHDKWSDIQSILQRIDSQIAPTSKEAQFFTVDFTDLSTVENIKKDFLRQLEEEHLISRSSTEKPGELRIGLKDPEVFTEIQKQVAYLLRQIESRASSITWDSKKIVPKTTIASIPSQKISPTENKISLIISASKGIYIKGQKHKSYKIKGNRLELLQLLKSGNKHGPVLAKTLYNENLSKLSDAKYHLNRLVKKNLCIDSDLIISLDTGGYALNHSDLDIVFQD